MNKVIFQFAVLAIGFFSVWLLLSQVNFMKSIHVDKINKINEKRIGDLIIENLQRNNKEIKSDSVTMALNEIKERICKSNNIDPQEIKVHLFDDEIINAFTLPDKHLILYTGLIKYCDNSDELAGIMAHEIGHMQHNHIMKRLIKELGIAVVLSIGGGNGEVLRKIIRTLSSSAFDRKQEAEADAAAVEYLDKARLDPQGLADFLSKLANSKMDVPKQLEWISTHPNSKERAKEILKLKSKAGIQYSPAIDSSKWNLLKRTASED